MKGSRKKTKKYKFFANYCPRCDDGKSSIEKVGRTLVHFKCDDCGAKWSRHRSDLYLHGMEIRLDPAKTLGRKLKSLPKKN